MSKKLQWWDPEKVRQDKVLQETRMPKSLEDVKTLMEQIRFEIASEDPSLFTQRPVSHATATTEK